MEPRRKAELSHEYTDDVPDLMDMLKKISFESYSVLPHDEDKINVGNRKSSGQLFCRWVHSDPPICNLSFKWVQFPHGILS